MRGAFHGLEPFFGTSILPGVRSEGETETTTDEGSLQEYELFVLGRSVQNCSKSRKYWKPRCKQTNSGPIRLLCSAWLVSIGFFERSVNTRLQGHTDQCCDQDRGIQLPDKRFCRGQRSRNAVDRIRVAIRNGRKGFKTEIDQREGSPVATPAASGVWK